MLKKAFILFSAICFGIFATAQKKPLQTIIIDPGHGGIDGGAEGLHSTEAQNALAISFKLRTLLNKTFPEIKTLMTREKDEFPGGGHNRNAALKYRAKFANENKGDLFICIHLNSTNIKYETRQEGTKTQTYYTYSTVGKGKHKHKIKEEHTREVPNYVRYKSPNQIFGTQTYVWAAGKSNENGVKINNISNNLDQDESISDSAMTAEMKTVEYRIKAQVYMQEYFTKSLKLANLVEEEFDSVGRKSFGAMQRNEKGIWVLQATNMPSILVETGFITDPKEEDYLSSDAGQEEVAQCIVNAVKRYKESLEKKTKANDKTELKPTMVADPTMKAPIKH